jgi:hypothetical protein
VVFACDNFPEKWDLGIFCKEKGSVFFLVLSTLKAGQRYEMFLGKEGFPHLLHPRFEIRDFHNLVRTIRHPQAREFEETTSSPLALVWYRCKVLSSWEELPIVQ